MNNYYEGKKRFGRLLFLRFQLVSSTALQRWMKNVVRHHLQSKGYYLIEDTKPPFSIGKSLYRIGRYCKTILAW